MEILFFQSAAWRWALTVGCGAAAVALARRRHRSAVGWGLLAVLAGWFLGIIGLAVPAWLATLEKVDLRRRYLELRVEERLLRALGGPDLGATISLEERILMVLANNPQGLHLNALAQGVGETWRAISDPVNRLVRRGKVRVRDDLYFIDSTAPPPAAEEA